MTTQHFSQNLQSFDGNDKAEFEGCARRKKVIECGSIEPRQNFVAFSLERIERACGQNSVDDEKCKHGHGDEYAASETISFMPTGQQDHLPALWRKAVGCMAGAQPEDDAIPLISNLKLTHLTHRWSLQLVTTIQRCHQQSASALLLEKLNFLEYQHGTRGRLQQLPVDHFSPCHWLVVPLSQTEHHSYETYASQGGVTSSSMTGLREKF